MELFTIRRLFELVVASLIGWSLSFMFHFRNYQSEFIIKVRKSFRVFLCNITLYFEKKTIKMKFVFLYVSKEIFHSMKS